MMFYYKILYFMGGLYPGGDCLGGFFPRGRLSSGAFFRGGDCHGGIFPRGRLSGGYFPGGDCPDTAKNNADLGPALIC